MRLSHGRRLYAHAEIERNDHRKTHTTYFNSFFDMSGFEIFWLFNLPSYFKNPFLPPQ